MSKLVLILWRRYEYKFESASSISPLRVWIFFLLWSWTCSEFSTIISMYYVAFSFHEKFGRVLTCEICIFCEVIEFSLLNYCLIPSSKKILLFDSNWRKNIYFAKHTSFIFGGTFSFLKHILSYTVYVFKILTMVSYIFTVLHWMGLTLLFLWNICLDFMNIYLQW